MRRRWGRSIASLHRTGCRLWDDGMPPTRATIKPARMKAFLPGLAIMGLYPDDTVRFRLAGTIFKSAFGFDPTGHDMLALTPPEQRAERLARRPPAGARHGRGWIRLSTRPGNRMSSRRT